MQIVSLFPLYLFLLAFLIICFLSGSFVLHILKVSIAPSYRLFAGLGLGLTIISVGYALWVTKGISIMSGLAVLLIFSVFFSGQRQLQKIFASTANRFSASI